MSSKKTKNSTSKKSNSTNLLDIKKKYSDDSLEIKIKGPNINYIIINTIRRSVLTYVPIYAFTNFNFIKNESIFNNNYIKLHMSNIPVLGIENNIIKLKKKIIEENQLNDELKELNEDKEYNLLQNSIDNIINDEEENKNDDINDSMITNSTLNQLTMYVNNTSKEKTNITITTNDVKFYYKEKNIKSPYKTPVPIIDLQPNQTINFSVITSLGTEEESAIFSAVSVCYYQQINDNEFNFILESRGQLKEERIIEVALLNLIETLEKILKLIPDNYEINGQILIKGENDTIGNLISHGLLNHPKIKFAGYNIPHLLDNKVVITYELNEKANIKEILSSIIKNFIDLFTNIINLTLK